MNRSMKRRTETAATSISTPTPPLPEMIQTTEPSTAKIHRSRRQFTAQEKCQAVLSLWSMNRSANAICREMAIQRPQLERWEEAALSGMMHALEEHRRAPENQPDKLPKHLEELLSRSAAKLISREKRLEYLQEKRTTI